ncbi:uncharacterized protein LOC119279276 [Triticum dicoccoides]|uniref:uncharacterized protein LOC119279276 n=1 Tax=Triticum dicoccoides TaxID=85692 RepID=UPI00188EC259|nr:uncharacterized protein LOC119279276 [Triticum dicoccoides]
MARLGLDEGDLVLMTSTSLPKATSIKLRPHTTDFLGAKDQKELLEHNLKNYSTVTVGDTITVAEGEKRYLLDVVEAKPADAVSTLDTDCEVDFATPLDYVQPPVAPAPVKVAAAPCQDCGERRFVGVGIRMDGKPVEQTPPPAPAPAVGSSGKGKSASENVLRFFGGRSVAVPPRGAKSAKKRVLKKSEGPASQAHDTLAPAQAIGLFLFFPYENAPAQLSSVTPQIRWSIPFPWPLPPSLPRLTPKPAPTLPAAGLPYSFRSPRCALHSPPPECLPHFPVSSFSRCALRGCATGQPTFRARGGWRGRLEVMGEEGDGSGRGHIDHPSAFPHVAAGRTERYKPPLQPRISRRFPRPPTMEPHVGAHHARHRPCTPPPPPG